jgi:hypothetical protein
LGRPPPEFGEKEKENQLGSVLTRFLIR